MARRFFILLLVLLLCQFPANAQAQAFQINKGITGSWFNAATPGQGLLTEVYPELEIIFLAWFSFRDDEGMSVQEWWTANGSYQGDSASLTIYQTNGGLFDQNSAVEHTAVGEIELKFLDCDHATLGFFFNGDDPNEFELVRLVPEQLCRELEAAR